MTGRGKHAPTGSQQTPASKRLKTVREWCADCCAAATAPCREGHRVLCSAGAEEAALAALEAAHREARRQQAFVEALADARKLVNPTVTASFDESVGNEVGWRVRGGSITIVLAAYMELTVDEGKAFCRALEGLDFEYTMNHTESTLACAYVEPCVLDVAAKLPDCVEGQAVRAGDVLLDAGTGCLEIFFEPMLARGSPNTYVFGYVTDGLDRLRGHGCPGRAHWDYDECWSRCPECFCVSSGCGGITTLFNVEFSD